MEYNTGSLHTGNKILFLFLISSSMGNEPEVICDGVIFNDVYFEKEVLFNNLGRPYNLVLHKYSGVLFFSNTIQYGTHVDFAITYCHLERRKCTELGGVPGGYAIAYDVGNDDIYFGGHQGLYKYNFMTKAAEYFAEKGKSIWDIFVKNHFYYIEYPTQKLYVYEDDMFVRVSEAENIQIDHFFISKQNDIYFSNKTALYKIEKHTQEVLQLDDDVSVRQIAEDAYGDVYFVSKDGIYLEEKPYLRITKVIEVDDAFGLTFDGNDLAIYSDMTSINRLVPSENSAQCYNALTTKTTYSDDLFRRLALKGTISR